MKSDVKWVTSEAHYKTAIRLHREFPARELYIVAAAVDYCGGDIDKARELLLASA